MTPSRQTNLHHSHGGSGGTAQAVRRRQRPERQEPRHLVLVEGSAAAPLEHPPRDLRRALVRSRISCATAITTYFRHELARAGPRSACRRRGREGRAVDAWRRHREMSMRPERMTTKSRAALQEALGRASRLGNRAAARPASGHVGQGGGPLRLCFPRPAPTCCLQLAVEQGRSVPRVSGGAELIPRAGRWRRSAARGRGRRLDESTFGRALPPGAARTTTESWVCSSSSGRATRSFYRRWRAEVRGSRITDQDPEGKFRLSSIVGTSGNRPTRRADPVIAETKRFGG